MLVACPDLAGVVFDLPSGLAAAPERLRAAGVSERSRVMTGDFFEAVPSGGDAYVLKQVLHDWPDERAADILSCCRAAMDPGSRLLVLERVLPEVADVDSAPALLLDMHMLVVTGGQERTRQEFAALLAGAGFELDRVSERLEPFGYHVIEATPVR
jgi:hypothetical protein